MRAPLSWLPLAAACALVAGCTTPMPTMPPGAPEYRIGFHDGCDAGYAYAGSIFYVPEDAAPPSISEPSYQAGWQAGYDACRSSYQRIQKFVSTVIGPA